MPDDTPGHVRPLSAGRAPDEVGHALLEAAHHVLATDGPFGLTVRRVAQVAGVSTMNVYSRFGGKDGLVDQLFMEGFTRLSAEMLEPPTDDPMEDLRRCGLAYRRFALAHPTYYMVMFDTVVPEWQPSPAAEQVGLGTLGGLAAVVQRAMDAGVLVDGDAQAVAVSFWATSHGLISLEMRLGADKHGIDWPAVYDATCDRLREGFRSRTDRADYGPRG